MLTRIPRAAATSSSLHLLPGTTVGMSDSKNQVKRRQLGSALAAAGLITALAACGGSGSPAPAGAAGTSGAGAAGTSSAGTPGVTRSTASALAGAGGTG